MIGKLRQIAAGPALCWVSLVAIVFSAAGCVSSPRLHVQAVSYVLDLELEPSTHQLTGRSTMELESADGTPLRPAGPVTVDLHLHPALRVFDVEAKGAQVRRYFARHYRPTKDNPLAPRTYAIVLDELTDKLTLLLDYGGEVYQNVAGGEIEGQIHNFEMRAHVSEEGVYLGGGNWYPQPAVDDAKDARLAEFTVLVSPIEGIELVAGAETDAVLARETGKLAWRTPYPVEEMVLVGGPHEVHRATHHGVDIALHLKPEQAEHAAGLFEAVKRNLDRYEPLIGAYPAREFAIVDNFFSSGFAFPTFTLLSSAVINMGKRSQTAHGYIDHEMLHCWWGNGIHVDPKDGNWCEALASYGANYYGFILDGKEGEARRKRRNYAHFLSRIKPERDKPLGTYGLEDGCGRGIAYSKGASVFHMLAREMGQQTFWSAMRRFTADYTGRYASWHDIQSVCESESGLDLETFFHQWIRRGGAPRIDVERAAYRSGDSILTLSIHQEDEPFALDLPVRIHHADGFLDTEIPVSQTDEEVDIPLDVVPLTVEIDPDYHVFRKIPRDKIVPTTASTRYGSAFATVRTAGDLATPYAKLQSTFESSFQEDERRTLTTGEIAEDDLSETCLLIVGDAVHDAQVAAFLKGVEFPVRWVDGGFKIGDKEFLGQDQAVVATAAHPGVPGGGITVFYGNTDAALPPAMLIPFYEHSVVVFEAGRPIDRRDLESRITIPVEPA